MSIAKIIAPLTGTARDAAVLTTAYVAAKPHNAHVVGLYVHPDPRLALPYTGAPISPEVVQEIVDAADEINRQTAKVARATFAEKAAAAGVEIVVAPKDKERATCSFREVEGFFPRCVADASRLSDLVVFGPIAPVDGPDLADAFVETLVKIGRPVLLGTQTPKSLTGKVMIAWDGSPAASRAVVSAMPFLEKADKIVLLSCCKASQKLGIGEVEEYLALHGLGCTEEAVDPGRRGIGETLLDAALKGGADLLVMGGYGHSQLGEIVFGGVTQHVRWHASLPVLMIH